MADGFVKIYSSILDSSVWREDSDTVRVWITLLAMADSDGVVRASVLGVSDRARVDLAQTEAALEKFQGPDPYSTNPDNEGRRVERVQEGWFIMNHELYRERRSKKQIQTANRVRRHRENRGSVTGNACNAGNDEKREVTAVTLEADTEAYTEADQLPPTEESLSATAPAAPDQFCAEWNQLAKDCGLRPCRKLSNKRLAAFRARRRDLDWREHYHQALERLRGIRWVRGANNRNWVADVDWFLRPETVNRLLEGAYDDNQRQIAVADADDSAGLF